MAGYRSTRTAPNIPSLVAEMKRITLTELTAPDVAAFRPEALPDERRAALEHAHAAIARLFFGQRQRLDDCAAQIREWIDKKVRRS